MSEMRPCRSLDCENTVSAAMVTGFCFNCLALLKTQEDELMVELDHLLKLEAEFVQFCQEHGLPHPHE